MNPKKNDKDQAPIVEFIKSTKEEETTPVKDPPAIIPPDAGDLSGDFDRDDYNLAKLLLKHGVDQRFSDVSPGNYIYSVGEEEYYTLAPPITLEILRLQKLYMQKVEQGERPQIAHSKEEVESLGGTLDAANPEGILFQPFADMTVLINGDKTPKAIASLDVLGAKCAPAMYRAKGTAYPQTAKVALTVLMRQKMSGIPDARLINCRWVLGVKQRQGSTFSYLVPTLAPGPANSPERIAVLKEVAANL
jgi:hypothetical protein